MDNNLSIHFGDNNTKSIIFAPKCKIKVVRKPSVIYEKIQIKQHSKFTYLGCISDETMSGVLIKLMQDLRLYIGKRNF